MYSFWRKTKSGASYMLPRQYVGVRIPSRYGPQMASPLGSLAALAKVRIYREIVANGIFPPIIV